MSKCQLLLQSLVLNGNEKTLEIPLWRRLIACDWDSVAGAGITGEHSIGAGEAGVDDQLWVPPAAA